MNERISPELNVLTDTNAPLAAKVAAAAELWSLIDSCEAALEAFKKEVRGLALATGKPVVNFEGDGLSQCKVVVPGPSLKLSATATVESERAALGELFNALYEVKLALRKADPAFISTFPLSVQAHIATVTTLVENTPRVSLKSLPGVTPVKGAP